MSVETAAAATRTSPRQAAYALAQATRPKQWVKNALVFAAPLAAGVLTRPKVFEDAVLAAVVFTTAAAGGYLINDVQDAAKDRLHPEKRHRPIASGALGTATAAIAGAMLITCAPLVALAADRELLAVLVLIYSATMLAYTAGLKHVPLVELLVLSSGFVLRPLAGAFTTNVQPSGWFLIVCCAGALTVVVGKRQVELERLGGQAVEHRKALAGYSAEGLRLLRQVSMPLTIAAYCGWALTRHGVHDQVLALLSAVPLGLAMLRLGALNDAGSGDAPEAVLLRDRPMQLAALAWALLFVLGLGRV